MSAADNALRHLDGEIARADPFSDRWIRMQEALGRPAVVPIVAIDEDLMRSTNVRLCQREECSHVDCDMLQVIATSKRALDGCALRILAISTLQTWAPQRTCRTEPGSVIILAPIQ